MKIEEEEIKIPSEEIKRKRLMKTKEEIKR